MAGDLAKYQAKSITPVDEYVCTLSDKLQKQAEEELNETKELRDKYLKEMRDWVLDNPRILKCRLDSSFILRFLRCHKYQIKLAKEAFERYLIFREGLYGYDWFTKLDIDRPHLQDLLNSGFFLVLPNRSVNGEKIIFVRCYQVDPSIDLIANVGLSLSTMIMEHFFNNEKNQVCGYRYIIDVSHITLQHYFVFSFGTWFRILKHIERTFAARHRACHIINMNSALRFIAKLALSHMREKMRNAIFFHSSVDELDFLDKKDLPHEYGGEMSIEKLVEPISAALQEKREYFLNYSNMKINREYYSQSVLNCDAKTLAHSLENKKYRYLTKYPDDTDSDEFDENDNRPYGFF